MGQEGIGKTHQMQVYNCGPIRAVLVLAEPQQLFGILHELLNGPAFVVRPDDLRGRERRGIGHEAEDVACRAFAREDHVEQA